jgi:hypothetical protein
MAVLLPSTPVFYAELGKLINLPPRVVALDLRLRLDEIPTVTCTYHPEIDSEALVTRHFDLVESTKKD